MRQIMFWQEELVDEDKTLSQIVKRLKLRHLSKKTQQIADQISTEYSKDPATNLSQLNDAIHAETKRRFEELDRYRRLGHLPRI